MREDMHVEIGKYTLESLTTGMYSDPKIIYREYIQNSVDSLEMAVKSNLIKHESMRIDIIIDDENSCITVRDNGIGIEADRAQSTLMNIGNSHKRHTNNRGFRGIGRLGGMSYCNSLVFSTSYKNENIKTIITFNCRRLKELLVPGEFEQYNLAEVLNEITVIRQEFEDKDKHYFCVELKDVSDFSDLLNIDKVKEYVSQVAPLSYRTKSFVYATEIRNYLLKRNVPIEEFFVYIGDGDEDLQSIYKPNKHRFHSDRNRKREDEISGIQFFDIIVENELYATGWYALCDWLGTISENEISGLRVRKGNILIGDSKTLNIIYKESRFNGWVQGEVFVVTDKLVPNARRDDFEQNEAYFKFIENLKNGIGIDITKLIREASNLRNDISAKVLVEVKKEIIAAKKDLDEGFNSSVDKEKIIEKLTYSTDKLNKTKVKGDLQDEKIRITEEIIKTVQNVADSNNYKINKINSGIDRKSKKILEIVSNILSDKLSKFLVDEILEEIISSLNRK